MQIFHMQEPVKEKNKSFRDDSHFMTVASLGQPQKY
jgi:hypothetical protein